MPSGIYINWAPLHASIIKMAKTMNGREIHKKIHASEPDESKHIPYPTLRAYIERAGIKTTRSRKLDAGDPALMYDLYYNHGLKVKEIAEKFDITRTWASNVIQDYRRGLESSGVS